MLDIGLIEETVKLLDTVLERHVDNTPAVVLTVFIKGEVHSAVHFFVDLTHLDKIQAVIQSIDKPSGIELPLVFSAAIPHSILRAMVVRIIGQKQILRVHRHDIH